MNHLGDLSNEELVVSFRARVKNVSLDEASIVAHLIEIEERRIYSDEACSSMWNYCVEREGFSESQAHTRLTAARVVRHFPLALEYLARGDIHLCGLTELRRALTPENHEALLREAAGKSTRALRDMIAARAPRPDVPTSIEPVASQTSLSICASSNAPRQDPQRAKTEPLSATRYRFEATVSAEVNDLVREIQDLMAHRNPTRDADAFLLPALSDFRDKLLKERFATAKRPLGKTSRPRKAAKRSTRPGYVPSEVRRAVFERDGAQCTYVDEQGRRCQERACLELHHVHSKGLGGLDTIENLRVRCRPHNQRDAELVFGREHVEQRIHCERSKRQAMRSPAFETAERGLVGDFGFGQKDVRAALAKIAAQPGASTNAPEDVIRAALRLLT